MSIIPLTHVCRYWRESIISTPENWTLISCKNEDMTAVCLKRAKAAPLEITVHMDTGAPSPDLLSPYLHNTRTLAVSFPPAIGELTEVFPNFPQSIPTLRSLKLVWVWDVDRDRTIDPFESFVPPLQHLYLAGIPLYPSLLGLRTLTEVTIRFSRFDFHLDTLLDFLEGNPSLESATLDIHFLNPSLLSSQRKTAMKNNLRHLYIDCDEKVDVQALISSIPLPRGADLDVIIRDELQHATLDSFLPEIFSAHLSNPPLPTFFRLGHIIRCREIKLGGPGGSISFHGLSWLGVSFADFAVLPLSDVREVHIYYYPGHTLKPPVFYPSYFPALETLIINCSAHVLDVLSALLSNSSPSPSLKTIRFLNCDLSEDLMKRLTKFASERQNIPTSTRLHRVQIVHREGAFPSVASIGKLRKYVKIVEVQRTSS